MRVIRTDFYYRSEDIRGTIGDGLDSPGISAAWFHVDGLEPDEERLYKSGEFDQRIQLKPVEAISLFPIFVDISLVGKTGEEALAAMINRNWKVENEGIAKDFLYNKIIIESSPPVEKPLIELIKGASIITLIGLGAADLCGRTGWGLMITIPIGIIVVGGSAGVANGLNAGLAEQIKNILIKKHSPGPHKAKS